MNLQASTSNSKRRGTPDFITKIISDNHYRRKSDNKVNFTLTKNPEKNKMSKKT